MLVRRNLRPRQLRMERLWIRPFLFAAIVGTTLITAAIPLDPLSGGIFVLALIAGVALGWQRGRFMRIEVDPETHAMSMSASPLGILIILALLGLKIVLRSAAAESQKLVGVPTATLTDGLSLFLGAAVITQSLEMWLRARRLLEAARLAKAARGGEPLTPPIVS
jgi:hypothetical protein